MLRPVLALTLSAADCIWMDIWNIWMDIWTFGWIFGYLDGYVDTDDKSLFLANQLVLRPMLTLTLSAAVARHSASRASVYTKSDVNLYRIE